MVIGLQILTVISNEWNNYFNKLLVSLQIMDLQSFGQTKSQTKLVMEKIKTWTSIHQQDPAEVLHACNSTVYSEIYN